MSCDGATDDWAKCQREVFVRKDLGHRELEFVQCGSMSEEKCSRIYV